MAAAEGKRKRNDDEEGNIGYILKALNVLQAYCSSAATPSRVNVSEKLDLHPRLHQLNDDVYELCKPSGRPSVEIVFFHGFQLGGSTRTHATTWLSRNGSELWPNWIRKSVPEVRILLVSYDGSATKKNERGRTDMYVTSENLVQSLTSKDAHVGWDGCPVILVGHSLGGLVIKEILLEAKKVLSFDKPEDPHCRVQSFFENVKQLFYYSCPHNGTRLADDKRVSQQGEIFELLTTLNTKAVRRNEEFRKLSEKYKWGAYSILERLPADLGPLGKQVVAVEASTRAYSDGYYTAAAADHFSVCQPASDTTDSSFTILRDIIIRWTREVLGGHQIETPTTLVGLNDHDQIAQVKTRLGTTQSLSICGIGGIGKSALAMAVYNAISRNFEYTSFVSEVKKKLVGEQVSTENLQEEILKNLYYKGNETKRKWDRLERKRVLIILDDVENESQVFVMPKTDTGARFFSDESRVLVTCRDRRIVSSKGFEVHDAEFLGEAASRELFCSHAFEEKHAPGPYKEDVKKFVEKCGGLPLALEVTGKYLYTQRDKRENKAIWNDAFRRLSEAQSLVGSRKDPLWSIFEDTYKDLPDEEQEMFLDIATCFHGDKKETANLVWRCCDWVTTADVGWQKLVDIGFVRADFECGSERIWMHELLRAFGRMKANREANRGRIESYSRVFYSELPHWPFKEGRTPPVKFLRIAAQDPDMESDVESDMESDMESDIVESDVESDVDRGIAIHIERLRGLENLKVLFLEGVKVYGASNLLPDNLEVLIMKMCGRTPRSSKSFYDAEDDYDIPRDDRCSTLGESSASRLGQHVSLRLMDFVPRQDLFLDPLFPDQGFEHLPTLEYLRIDSWESRPQGDRSVSLPDSRGQRRSLRELDIDLESLTRFPDSLGQLRSVQKLAICSRTLTRLPESLGRLQSLRELEIHCSRLTGLPDSLKQLGRLVLLRILFCKGLTALPDTLGQLDGLRELYIGWCSELTALPDNLGDLGGLRKLKIVGCDGLTALPDTLGQLNGLRELNIEECSGLTALPGNLGDLGGLRKLKIVACDGLTALPDSLGQLGRPQELNIEECSGLTAQATSGT